MLSDWKAGAFISVKYFPVFFSSVAGPLLNQILASSVMKSLPMLTPQKP